ncbi:GNAT family N-acetyltransferase [Curtobacterium sp. MCPF17_002]|uniref:GNAT family N-acetyltransferase n=1 Tax=Curtobacterium sp. MCPF17_002 TaxID=2175645 RepID=UPI000DA98C66|nr:GNAT family N-acetyltransferase [Curtobacterium sp. MCPF17_002]WIB76754.1 GNAT family N-acetyltransferase [Curtobacterium sp. MCPF17_002]
MTVVELVRLDPTGADRDELIRFLAAEEFPFHMRSTISAEDASTAVDSGSFRDAEHDTSWLVHADHGRIGIVRLEDLEDPVPLFDLRIAGRFRGQGLGVPALCAVTDHVFRTMPSVTRFEGQTREDNTAMRRVFVRAGWVKEAHYREAWPVHGAAPVASVAYGMLRGDWETGRTTPVPWDDDEDARAVTA